jgi:hypothetical protein
MAKCESKKSEPKATKETPWASLYKRKDGWTSADANVPLTITITPEHVARAKCNDPAQCVVAQALMDHFGGMVDGFECGSNITKIYSIGGKICTRYSTGSALRRSLVNFDKTKKWDLPPGVYQLNPLANCYRREARWHKKKNSGGVRSVFNAKRQAPTRHAATVCQIIRNQGMKEAV